MLFDMTDPSLRELEFLIERMEKGEVFHRKMAEARRLLAEVRRDLETPDAGDSVALGSCGSASSHRAARPGR